MTGTLLAGATTDVIVTLSTPFGTAAYAATATIIGGTGLLGKLVVQGIVGQTSTTVTVRVQNTGLAGLASTGATISVVAVRLT
ncbi:hypothetical protein EDF38_1294 [Frigoribacterium sp. PhB160]|uniref:hypothetical protein n=1 Tax=Frigoribacterium sp. PhB160 TaxID=2485192 RepID=UPI000F48587C|nr:hypothetical protein [Frigoribacterium sp. PhB160]ROS62191.1 hypothetical protein EDF38_1294 [Frigoribacterium sp. PhB160]